LNARWWAGHFLSLHVAETGGNNRGPLVDVFEQFVHVPLGSSWCAAFASYCFHKTYADDPHLSGKLFPYSGGSQAILHSFRFAGLVSDDPQDLLKWRGALFVWTDPDGVHGHIGFITGRLTDDGGKVVAVETIEGNAGPGSGGVVALRRIVPVTQEGHRMHFLDTSSFMGGAWW
jgi:hypothetical protein